MFCKTLVMLICLSTSPFALAARNDGAGSGGGGDAMELRVNEIRSDILSWINKEGAKDLSLPKSLSYGQYVDSMTNILEAKKVIIEFTEEKVLVNRAEKTCRGFFLEDGKASIRCNISRFKNTSESEQYKLIHHEYAGLVNIENNDGAASDYEVSSQITDYLSEQKVLKLAINKTPKNASKEKCKLDTSLIEELEPGNKKIINELERNGFTISSGDAKYSLKAILIYCKRRSCDSIIARAEIINNDSGNIISIRGIDKGGIFTNPDSEKAINDLIKNLPRCE